MPCNYSSIIAYLETKVRKKVPVPKVIEKYDENFSGVYILPGEFYKGIKSKDGVIMISTDCSSKEKEAVLVHEWRHHWQWHRNKWRSGLKDPLWISNNMPRKQYIQLYFREQPWEMDALEFSCRVWNWKEDFKFMKWIKEF